MVLWTILCSYDATNPFKCFSLLSSFSPNKSSLCSPIWMTQHGSSCWPESCTHVPRKEQWLPCPERTLLTCSLCTMLPAPLFLLPGTRMVSVLPLKDLICLLSIYEPKCSVHRSPPPHTTPLITPSGLFEPREKNALGTWMHVPDWKAESAHSLPSPPHQPIEDCLPTCSQSGHLLIRGQSINLANAPRGTFIY